MDGRWALGYARLGGSNLETGGGRAEACIYAATTVAGPRSRPLHGMAALVKRRDGREVCMDEC